MGGKHSQSAYFIKLIDKVLITSTVNANYIDFSLNLHDFYSNNRFTALFPALNCLKLFTAWLYLPVNTAWYIPPCRKLANPARWQCNQLR